MRGRPKSKESTKSKQITCRLTPEEYTEAAKKAAAQNMLFSEFVRCKITEKEPQ